jgi:geranylgeranyl diphosphate synthase type II
MTEAAAARYLARQQAVVEAALARRFPPRRDPLRRAIRYALLSGGKRVRPLLTVATSRLLGAPSSDALPFACALEMIHTSSLVHDDLPSMDDDDLRRGQPTTHKVFGEGLAILVGDALLTEAFETMAAAGRVPCERRVVAMREVAMAAGEAGMVGGQALDLAAEGGRPSLATVRAIHRRKTGALLRAAVRTGAIVAGAPRAVLARLTTFGEALGLAFQITDDVLDAYDDPAADGRTDVALEKATYPTVIGLAASCRHAERAGASALAAIARHDGQAEPLRLLVRRVVARVGSAAAS